jgi:hypothetical protein
MPNDSLAIDNRNQYVGVPKASAGRERGLQYANVVHSEMQNATCVRPVMARNAGNSAAMPSA